MIHGCKSGRSPFLTPKEEKEMYDWLLVCANIGYPKRRDDVIGIVRKALKNKFGSLADDFSGKGWRLRFMERWPSLRLRKADGLAQSRANAVNSVNIKNYFVLLEKTLEEKESFNCPNRIYNMDESGLPLDHNPSKVIAMKGARKVHCRTSGNKMQITILACANAAGTVIPPMVVFQGKRLNPEWTKGEVPCTLYGMSDKGWTDMELFSYWLKDLFIPSIPPARPVLLLLDGHSSHYDPETIRYAASHGVVILCLPPHTTHVSQPLDVSFFKPLKMYWYDTCHRYMGRVVTKFQFSSLFSTAWYKATRPENIISGFRKVGIYPFDATAISVPDVSVCENTDEICATGSDVAEYELDESEDENNLSTECGLSEETTVCGEVEEGGAVKATFSSAQVDLYETRFENGYVLVSVCIYC